MGTEERPDISIIVPVYNAENTIERCVNSLLNQTHQNVEIILVDDCSTDKSRVRCEELAQQDRRIKLVFKKKNEGTCCARNDGLVTAQGSYIMFADNDDWVDTHWCEYLFDAVKSNPKALISSNIYIADEEGVTLKVPDCQKKYEGPTELDYFGLFKYGLSGFVWNKIFDKKIIDEHNIRFIKGRIVGEDVTFVLTYLKFCTCCKYLSSPLYYWFMRKQSVSHVWHEGELIPNIELFLWRLPFIKEHQIGEFCDIHFSYFIGLLENIMDPRCEKTFLWKMRYNQKAMKSDGFRYCVEHISGCKESPHFVYIVRRYNYYLLWSYQKACIIKDRLMKLFK